MMEILNKFNELLKKGVFQKGGAMVEWTDFHPITLGYKVVVRYKGNPTPLLARGELVEATGFIGAKGEENPSTVQYSDSIRNKKYIPMDDVEIHSVGKRNEDEEKEKKEKKKVAQKKLRAIRNSARASFSI